MRLKAVMVSEQNEIKHKTCVYYLLQENLLLNLLVAIATMQTLTHDQRLALLVVPVLVFGVFGVNNYAIAGDTDFTDEQKEAIIEAHELRESGNFEGARNILEKVRSKNSITHGTHGLGNGEVYEKSNKILKAIENNDYLAYIQATKGSVLRGTVTKHTFDIMVQAYTFRKEGAFDKAQALLERAGIERHGQMIKSR